MEQNQLKETIKNITTKYIELTKSVLMATSDINEQYSSLNPLLKKNFDQNFLNNLNIFVLSLLENLKINSVFSKENETKQINDLHIFDIKTSQEQKYEDDLKKLLNCHFKINEISHGLKSITQHSLEKEINSIKSCFDKIYIKLKEEGEDLLKKELKPNTTAKRNKYLTDHANTFEKISSLENEKKLITKLKKVKKNK